MQKTQLRIPNSKITVFFKSEKPQVPWNYSELVQKTIYKILDNLHIGRYAHTARYSLFNYSLIAIEPKYTADSLLSNNWLFRFASVYEDMLLAIGSYLSNHPSIQMLNGIDNKFRIASINSEAINNRHMFYANPILVISRDKARFLTPDQPEFYQAVKRGLINRYQAFTEEEQDPNTKFVFTFTEPPKQKLIQYKNRKLLAFEGPVRLAGDPELIRFAQTVGLGQLPSCGFGMLL